MELIREEFLQTEPPPPPHTHRGGFFEAETLERSPAEDLEWGLRKKGQLARGPHERAVARGPAGHSVAAKAGREPPEAGGRPGGLWEEQGRTAHQRGTLSRALSRAGAPRSSGPGGDCAWLRGEGGPWWLGTAWRPELGVRRGKQD